MSFIKLVLSVLIIYILFLIISLSLSQINRNDPLACSLNPDTKKTHVETDQGIQFEYPSNYKLFKSNLESEHYTDILIYCSDKHRVVSQILTITIPPKIDINAYPKAEQLTDYLTPKYFSGFHTVMLDSNETISLNGLHAFKQRYRAGTLTDNDLRLEGLGSTLNGIRYVIAIGQNNFMIMSTDQSSNELLEFVATTLKMYP